MMENEKKLDDNEAASISKAAESLAATWLEQSLTAMQNPEDDAKKEKRSTVSFNLLRLEF